MRKNPIIETQYFPCIGWFYLAVNAGSVTLEREENYQKGSFRNRCLINGPQKILQLSVPLASGKHQKMPIDEVRISYDEDWAKVHWRSIATAYGSAPFFLHYKDEVQELLFLKNEKLFDLNLRILRRLMDLLGLEFEVRMTNTYQQDYTGPMLDAREIFKPGQRKFKKLYSIDRRLEFYQPVFPRPGHPRRLWSVLDLLFCAGPACGAYLRDANYREKVDQLIS